jgi:hypothetical protein
LKIANTNEFGTTISRYCEWVGRKDVTNRCSLQGVSAACPVTCGTCAICADPGPNLRFSFDYNGKTISKNCDFVGRVPGKVWGRCDASEKICRMTCGAC